MRIVLQRVLKARICVDTEKIASIDKGIVALVGISENDNLETYRYMFDKIVNLRIFEDSEKKLNLSLKDLSYELLIVPNFTIYADARKGRRPNFSASASPDIAEKIFDEFVEFTMKNYNKVQTGIFRADMKVSLVNDGPITIILDSDKIF